MLFALVGARPRVSSAISGHVGARRGHDFASASRLRRVGVAVLADGAGAGTVAGLTDAARHFGNDSTAGVRGGDELLHHARAAHVAERVYVSVGHSGSVRELSSHGDLDQRTSNQRVPSASLTLTSVAQAAIRTLAYLAPAQAVR